MAPDPPAAAYEVFGDRLPLAVRYACLLAGSAVERGLIGPREPDRLWTRHLLNCAGAVSLLPRACSVVDVGSGAGLPGIVLALARPDLRITLVEPMQRRTVFLEECVTALALERSVSVRRARVESLHGRLTADVVTARALAPLGQLISWCWPLVQRDGCLVAFKGATAAVELARNADVLPAGASAFIHRSAEPVAATMVVLRRSA